MVSKSVSERVAGRKVNGFCLEMTPSGRFWGSKIENFRFFFFRFPNEFLYGLGVVWGLYKWILAISGEPCEVREDRDAREAREADFSSTIRDLEKFLVFRPKSKKIAFSDFRFWAPKGFVSVLDGSWGLFGH